MPFRIITRVQLPLRPPMCLGISLFLSFQVVDVFLSELFLSLAQLYGLHTYNSHQHTHTRARTHMHKFRQTHMPSLRHAVLQTACFALLFCYAVVCSLSSRHLCLDYLHRTTSVLDYEVRRQNKHTCTFLEVRANLHF